MRLEVTRKSDLAVRALRVLAARTVQTGGRTKGTELAARLGSTPGFVAQVMQPLVQRGWVQSDPGPTGGYTLVADLADISVLAVIESIEGPTDTGRCVLANRNCVDGGPCALHAPWVAARAQLLSSLAQTSVAEAAIVEPR